MHIPPNYLFRRRSLGSADDRWQHRALEARDCENRRKVISEKTFDATKGPTEAVLSSRNLPLCRGG